MVRMDADEQEARAEAAGSPRLGRVVQGLADATLALVQRFASSEGLVTTDARALGVLALAGRPMTASQLGDRLALTSGATTRLVDRLEAAGHVVRRSDDSDRRLVWVAHTATADQVARAWFAPLGVRLGGHLQRHDPATQEAIVNFLETLVSEIEATGPER